MLYTDPPSTTGLMPDEDIDSVTEFGDSNEDCNNEDNNICFELKGEEKKENEHESVEVDSGVIDKDLECVQSVRDCQNLIRKIKERRRRWRLQ